MSNILSKLKYKWNQSPIMRALTTLVSGQVLGQALGLLAIPVVSRLYDKTAYGEFAIITSTATIVCSLSQLGLASAIMMPSEEEEARKVFSTGFWVQFTIVTLFFASAVAITPYFKLFDVGVSYIMALVLLYVYMLLTNFTNYMRIYMNRKKLYRALFWNSIISGLSTLCITIPLGIAGAGFMGLLSASLISYILCSIQMLLKANPFTKLVFGDLLAIIKKYKEFVLYQFPSNMVSSLSQQLPNQMFSKGFGSAALGSYSMSYKVFNLPSNLIAVPINTVYFKTAVEYHQEGKDLASFTFSLVSKIMLLAFIPLVILLSFGEPIFEFVLGIQWREAGLIASILGIQYVLVFCVSCTSYCRVSVGRQKINLMMSVLQLIVIATSLIIGIFVFTGLIPTIVCFAIGNTVIQIVDMTVNFYCLKKYVLRYLIFVLMYCVVAMVLELLLRTLFH